MSEPHARQLRLQCPSLDPLPRRGNKAHEGQQSPRGATKPTRGNKAHERDMADRHVALAVVAWFGCVASLLLVLVGVGAFYTDTARGRSPLPRTHVWRDVAIGVGVLGMAAFLVGGALACLVASSEPRTAINHPST
jgi:hypothetical protein